MRILEVDLSTLSIARPLSRILDEGPVVAPNHSLFTKLGDENTVILPNVLTALKSLHGASGLCLLT